MAIRKRYQLNFMFECPDAVLTCSVLRCKDKNFLVFGGHDKTLYLMDEEMNIVDDRSFDGWCRCSYPIDLDSDGCDEVLVGSGDGSFMVLKINEEKKNLVGLMRYKSRERVTCCIAGDFTRDGNIELIFGSEDKTLKIFNSLKATEPKFILYYDSWVTTCSLGYLKLPDEKFSIYGLLVGTKGGLTQLIQFKDDLPDIIWSKNFNTQINDIKVGDVTNDGFNEILLSADDSTIKILNVEGELIKEIKTEEGRPISLLVEDIDGDSANEIVAGCADGSLRVFHNPSLNSTDFELKWKTKVSSSIKHICYQLDRRQNKKNIIFGGYDRAIRIISDFEWGDKPSLEIPQVMKMPEVEPTEKERVIEELAEIKEVPTNIREYIFKILTEKDYLKDLVSELTKLEYSEDEILEELTMLKTQKPISYEKMEYSVWSLPEEETGGKVEIKVPIKKPKVVAKKPVEKPIIPEATLEKPKVKEPKVAVKHMVIEEPIRTDKEKLSAVLKTEAKDVSLKEGVSLDKSLPEVIIDYLKQHKLVATKAEFIVDIKSKGFEVKDIEKEINNLKTQGKISYSRSAPKGWSLVE
ncbi:MAG: hypothetical protein ACFFB0_09010 [Promethearchaeota archaeon]